MSKSTETAEKIKALRKKTGLTQTEFGEICGGIPLRTIQNWEAGKNECPAYVYRLLESYIENENLI